jgi:hypothetical protein
VNEQDVARVIAKGLHDPVTEIRAGSRHLNHETAAPEERQLSEDPFED